MIRAQDEKGMKRGIESLREGNDFCDDFSCGNGIFIPTRIVFLLSIRSIVTTRDFVFVFFTFISMHNFLMDLS